MRWLEGNETEPGLILPPIRIILFLLYGSVGLVEPVSRRIPLLLVLLEQPVSDARVEIVLPAKQPARADKAADKPAEKADGEHGISRTLDIYRPACHRCS